jgi:predicted membrane-bound spermidine synthase
VAAVVRMLEKQKAVHIGYANRLMLVCCGSYLANALIQIHFWIGSFFLTMRITGGYHVMFLPAEIALAVPALVPVLYAVSICILYKHFTNMVQFESEVA